MPRRSVFGLVLLGLGVIAALVALLSAPGAGLQALQATWPPFVLVTGLLLVGLVADRDGLFEWAGYGLARVSSGKAALGVAIALVSVVTVLLNLDTAVAFLTPVLFHAARRQRADPTPFLVAAILLANGASLLLVGSNLTNLIVLGPLHLATTVVFGHLALAWLASVLVTGAVLIGSTRSGGTPPKAAAVEAPAVRVVGIGPLAVIAVAVAVVLESDPALTVAAIGVASALVALVRRQVQVHELRATVNLPVILGLFGTAIALGTLGRSTDLLGSLVHLDAISTAIVAAVASLVINNLPAAALLSAHASAHPYALLIGLDLGPNAFVTGSLAWLLWIERVRASGARPPIWRAVRVGALCAPLAMAAALVALRLG